MGQKCCLKSGNTFTNYPQSHCRDSKDKNVIGSMFPEYNMGHKKALETRSGENGKDGGSV